jgi:hypothetical protein
VARIPALREEIGVGFDLLPRREVVKPVALATAASRSAVLTVPLLFRCESQHSESATALSKAPHSPQ